MRWGWLCGWSVDREAFAALCRERLPAAQHVVETPTREGRERLLAAEVDVFAGYSLGAWLLLEAAAQGWRPPQPVRLIAPFLAFPAEANRGGRVRRAQLRVVSRMLATDPGAAVLDFSVRAGLTVSTMATLAVEELVAGLTALGRTDLTALPPAAAAWSAYLGTQDSLVDATALAPHWPGLRLVPEAGHGPAALLEALAREENLTHAI